MDLNRSGRSSKLSEFQVITEEPEDSGEVKHHGLGHEEDGDPLHVRV